MRIIAIIFFAVNFLISTCVVANDTIGGLSAGGIEFEKTKDISMNKEILTISKKLVRVEYEFENISDHTINKKILFPMPFYSFNEGCSDERTYGDLENFKLWVDGKKIKTMKSIRAELPGGIDVTAKLKNMGFNEDDIANYMGVKSYCTEPNHNLPEKYTKNINLLIKEGLVGSKPLENVYLPLWKTSHVYSWDQEFLPKKIVHVVHEYTPDTEMHSGGTDFKNLSNLDSDFCFTNDTIKMAIKLQGRKDVLYDSIVKYILVTGANWSGPIKDFTLNIKKDKQDEIVSLCFDGGFKKMDSLTVTSHIINFVPQKDLNVAFFYKNN